LIQLAVPVLNGIIANTAKQRDEWDNSPDGNIWKTLRHAVATHQKPRLQLVVASEEESNKREVTYHSNVIQLKNLQVVWDAIIDKLRKALRTLAEQQIKLNKMQQASVETKVFWVLKEIGVELSSYHGGSFIGKDIKKVMNNATHLFDAIAAIFKEGKRDGCLMSDTDIHSMCLHFWEVYVLWDGAFLLARMVNPTLDDAETYQKFV
jgi:hypothetical protein